jgi:uncharacterized membrane protein YkvA (DUF1232 family)
LPALRERFTKIPSQTYPYLSDELEFLSLVVKNQVAGLNRDLTAQTVAEAAFALYFQSRTDLIPDPIPGMGLLDDAMIVSMVLRCHEHAFKVVRTLPGYAGQFPASTSIIISGCLATLDELVLLFDDARPAVVHRADR